MKDIRKVRSITYISTRVGRLWPISISTHCSKSNSLKKHIYLNIRTSQHCTIQTHVYKNNINCPVTTRSSIAGYNRWHVNYIQQSSAGVNKSPTLKQSQQKLSSPVVKMCKLLHESKQTYVNCTPRGHHLYRVLSCAVSRLHKRSC